MGGVLFGAAAGAAVLFPGGRGGTVGVAQFAAGLAGDFAAADRHLRLRHMAAAQFGWPQRGRVQGGHAAAVAEPAQRVLILKDGLVAANPDLLFDDDLFLLG